VLIARRNVEIAENHNEDKEIIYAQRFFKHISGKKLYGFLVVEPKINAYIKFNLQGRDLPILYEYCAVIPYEFNVVNIHDIEAIGYSRIPFEDLIFPNEIEDQVVLPARYYNNVHMGRFLYSIYLFTYSGKPENHYSYFAYVPEMAENNLSGLEIATNPELALKYFGRRAP
jgi:hypothetical protein